MITVSTPGKLILLGEHAVVYGQPCIVTAVDMRLTVSAELINEKQSVIDTGGVDTRFVDAALAWAKEHWHLENSVRLTITSGFSGTYGFGSSAAVTVAVLKACAVLAKKDVDSRALFEAGREVVQVVQGTGSGVDVAAAVWGGTVYFANGGTVIEPLITSEAPLVIGYSGQKADTVSIVNEVKKKREQYPEKVDRIMQAIGQYVEQGKKAMGEGDWERVGKIMNFSQEYLRDLGVSSEKLEALIKAATDAGAWGAKLSGAGGGDCMIALVPDGRRTGVMEAIKNAGGEVVNVGVGAEGARVESTDDQKELFIVVDTDDNVLEYKTRYECHHSPTLIHRAVNVLIFDDHGRVLLQKRSQTKDTSPGLWSTSVGGHVTKGDNYEQAAARELKEELGIEIPLQFHSKFIFPWPMGPEMEELFTAKSNGPFAFNKEEIEEVAFFTKEELPRKLLTKEIVLTDLAFESLKRVGFI